MNKFFSILIDNFSTLKNKTIRIYIGGQSISLVGTWMQQTAQAWVVWQLSGSTAALGTIALVSQLPFFILGPWAGSLADRLNRRRVLIGTQTVAMLLAFILAFLVTTHLVQLWHVYLLALLLGIVSALDLPAQQAFIGDISGKELVQKTVGLNSSLQQLTRMVGPALAGWTIAQLGVATAFWINGISFIAVIFSLTAIKSTQIQPDVLESGFAHFLEGLKFIKNQPILRLIIFFTIIQLFFGFSIIQLLPAVATDVLKGQADLLGLLLGATGAGAFVGTIFVVPFMRKVKHPALSIGAGVIWSGFWYTLLSFSSHIPSSLLCQFMAGTGGATTFTISLGLMQTLAPQHMRARILSAMLMMSFGLQPIASMIVGFLAELIGITNIIFFNGTVMVLLATVLIWGEPILRKFIFTINPADEVEEYSPPFINKP